MASGNAGKGRPKGVPNKTNAAIKDMVVTALSNVGGVKYLERQANEQPVAFMGLVGKVLPLQITGEGGTPLVFQVVKYADDNDPS